jgi:hypothetical protein
LTLPHYFALCYRITAYEGAVARVIEDEQQREKVRQAIEDGQLSRVADNKVSGAEYTRQVLAKRKKANSANKPATDLRDVVREANYDSPMGDLIQFG